MYTFSNDREIYLIEKSEKAPRFLINFMML